MRRSMLGSPHWCHLCGLIIPQDIAHPHHDLAPTIDHVHPTSRGGRDVPRNRQAAHRICNQRKADRPGFDSVEELEQVREVVATGLRRLEAEHLPKLLARARKRVPCPPAIELHAKRNAIMRWEDDGGAVDGL